MMAAEFSGRRLLFLLPGVFNTHFPGRHLQRLLRYADCQPRAVTDTAGLFLSYIFANDDVGMSKAVTAYWADFNRPPPLPCLRCDPVHLQADMTDAVLFDSSAFSLSQTEAAHLTAGLNDYLQEYGWRVEFADPRRWYLLCERDPGWITPDVSLLNGRPVAATLTDSAYSAEWRRVLSELQIILYQQPVNAERERRGELPVNGVWIYGGGPQPAAAPYRIVSSQPLAAGIARHYKLEYSDDLQDAISSHSLDTLVFDSVSAQIDVQQDEQWFGLAWRYLRQKRLAEVVIDAGDGRRFVITPALVRRFWRRFRPLSV
jgi:hypothetical protein